MSTALQQWRECHGFGELTYDYWLGWYEHRTSYPAGTDLLGALDNEAIRITSAGRNNWSQNVGRAAELVTATAENFLE